MSHTKAFPGLLEEAANTNSKVEQRMDERKKAGMIFFVRIGEIDVSVFDVGG